MLRLIAVIDREYKAIIWFRVILGSIHIYFCYGGNSFKPTPSVCITCLFTQQPIRRLKGPQLFDLISHNASIAVIESVPASSLAVLAHNLELYHSI